MATDLVTRRTTLKFAALITLAAQGWRAMPADAAMPPAKGYGSDPDLLKRIVTWPRTLSAQQLATLAVLCDIVLPAEPPHPSAQALGVHEFLDEWVSAPYPQMQADRTVILNGLAALEEVARKEHGVPFEQADRTQQTAAFERSCGNATTAEFSRRLIALICGGYYTTRQGHVAIGYVGNVPLASFPPPTPEIVRRLEKALSELPPYAAHKS